MAQFRFRGSTEVKVTFTEVKVIFTEVKVIFTEEKPRSTEVKSRLTVVKSVKRSVVASLQGGALPLESSPCRAVH